jgi:uncharacterized protein
MRIFVKAKTGSKEEKVVEPEAKLIPDDEPVYTVHVKERPVEGRANDAIVRALAEHFGVTRSAVKLVKGATSKMKMFNIEI